MSRSQFYERVLHPINVGLLATHYLHEDGSDWIEYRAQDFWVYFGLKAGLGLDYLMPLFDRGAGPEAADAFFAQEHQTSLGAEYWSWVKNQAMEKTIDFGGRLTDPCRIQADVIGTPKQLLYPPLDAPPWVEGSLPRLTSEVVRIIFSGENLGQTTVRAEVTEGTLDQLSYKVYVDGEAGCSELADDARTFEQLVTPEVVYVILANRQYQPENLIKYRVSVAQQ